MNKRNKCLIAVDLDNTILSDLFSLNAESVSALIRAQSDGHIVMIATARPESMSLPYHRAMGLHGPICILNGAYCYHPDDPAFPQLRALIPEKTVGVISSAVRDTGTENAWIEDGDNVMALRDPPDDIQYFKEVFRQSRVTYHDALPMVPAARICIQDRDDSHIREVYERIVNCEEIHCMSMKMRHGGSRINCASKQADKWYAIRHAAQQYGIPLENTICFGDEVNDKMMLQSAGYGFVLCNGSEALKDAGIEATTYPCNAGGVANELRKLLF